MLDTNVSLARTVVRAPKSGHISITPILRSLYWLRVNECIEYAEFFMAYKIWALEVQELIRR